MRFWFLAIAGVAGIAVAAAADSGGHSALAFVSGALIAGWCVRRREREASDGTAGADELASSRQRERQLEAALARRDEQLAHTAHELRTPLASVLMALEMVRDGYANTPAEQAEFLDEASLAARHLTFLVNDVLDSAALTAGRLQLDRGTHGVAALLADGLRILGLQAERRGIAVRCDAVAPDLAMLTDPRRFLQVLFNLLGNALKFSAAGQPIRIAVEASDQRVRIRILDQGPGVPPELRARLFTPFGRGDDDAGQPSTGLGLFITRQLVEQMDGSIGYLPRLPRGSEFWFELPRATLTEAAGKRGVDQTQRQASGTSVAAGPLAPQ
jgi:signal transduction histidine kinase